MRKSHSNNTIKSVWNHEEIHVDRKSLRPFSSLPLIQDVDEDKRKHVHEVLVNRLVKLGPPKSVVRGTDLTVST